MEVTNMTWRPTKYLREGELDNTRPNKVTGWMKFAGKKDKVTFNLEGNFHRDIRGAKIRFTGDAYEDGADIDSGSYLEGFAPRQTGRVGDITAGLPPYDYGSDVYIEWYSAENGRIVLELESAQIEVIGRPIPAIESDPISRDEQRRNMAEFLGNLAQEMDIPQENVICVGEKTVVQADKRAANNRIRGMTLLPKEIRRKLPPLYSQDGKGGKAIAWAKYFMPSGQWTWYITEYDGEDTFFGLVDGHFKELGYFRLSELESVNGPMGLPIERDLYWQPKTLEKIAPELFAPVDSAE
jgi:hypothetical protein